MSRAPFIRPLTRAFSNNRRYRRHRRGRRPPASARTGAASTTARPFNASAPGSDHDPALAVQDATTFSLRRSAPNAELEVVRQGVVEALGPHGTFRADLLCRLDPEAVGRKEPGWIRAPTTPLQHPGWLRTIMSRQRLDSFRARCGRTGRIEPPRRAERVARLLDAARCCLGHRPRREKGNPPLCGMRRTRSEWLLPPCGAPRI